MKRLATLVVAVQLIGGCADQNNGGEDYFPLSPGLRWTYRITTDRDGDIDESHLTIRSLGIKHLNGEPHGVRETDKGTLYYARASTNGVYRAAKKTIIDLAPRPDASPRWILRKPYRIGTDWNHVTHPYVLQRIQPYREELSKKIDFKMAYQIGALNETVDVPAGRFDNCIRVDGEALLSIYADARTGYQDIEINAREWYAPGVGLVKLERTEPLTGDTFTGGRISMELETFGR